MTPYYLGIDISKGYADFMILNAKKQPVEHCFQLDDTFDGHSCLHQKLCRFFEDHPQSVLYAAVESTGGYENNWFHTLTSFQTTLNIKTARLNPRGVNNNKKASLNRITTDPISAKAVAEYLIAHPEKVSYQNQDSLAPLRKQWNFIQMLNKQKTQLLNQFESLMYCAHPQLLSFCKGGVPQWILKLVMRYPTGHKLAKAKVASIAKIPYVSISRAEGLRANAQNSIASANDEVTENLLSAVSRQILNLDQLIRNQTQRMAERCRIPEIDTIKVFKELEIFQPSV